MAITQMSFGDREVLELILGVGFPDLVPILHNRTGSRHPPPITEPSTPSLHSGHYWPRGWLSGKEGPGCTAFPFRPRALIWKQAQCWAFRRAWVWTWGIS